MMEFQLKVPGLGSQFLASQVLLQVLGFVVRWSLHYNSTLDHKEVEISFCTKEVEVDSRLQRILIKQPKAKAVLLRSTPQVPQHVIYYSLPTQGRFQLFLISYNPHVEAAAPATYQPIHSLSYCQIAWCSPISRHESPLHLPSPVEPPSVQGVEDKTSRGQAIHPNWPWRRRVEVWLSGQSSPECSRSINASAPHSCIAFLGPQISSAEDASEYEGTFSQIPYCYHLCTSESSQGQDAEEHAEHSL